LSDGAERIIGSSLRLIQGGKSHHLAQFPGDPRHLAPWGKGEELIAWQELQEKCEGKQVSGVYYLTGELPKGWQGIGLELTTSEVMVFMAAPVVERGFRARLLLRWISRQQIWTPGMDATYGQGKGRAVADDFIKRQLQGEVLRGFTKPKDPTPEGGDLWLFEFRSGLVMRLLAEPDGDHQERSWAAALDLQLIAPSRSRFTV
jgi:hypothetical protein